MTQDDSPHITVVVGAAILGPDGALLAARRSAPARLAGRWEFPGGKVEVGESESEALHREIDEELGVTIEIGDRLPGEWPLRADLTLKIWTATITSGTPAPLEDHDELRWLAPGEWRDVEWLPADWPVVEALATFLNAPWTSDVPPDESPTHL